MDNGIYSQRLRAGRRRTYFFDVRTTKNDDYYITITESKKKFDEDGYERHKLFLYKEDFNKFIAALENTVNHVKTDLLPDYDFEEFDRELEEGFVAGEEPKHTEPVTAQDQFQQEEAQIQEQEQIKKEADEVTTFVDGDLSF